MLETDKIRERLEQFMQEEGLTPAAFADRIAVGRPTVSHILSGRNKPSLDFMVKVIAAFPRLSLDVLVLGNQSVRPSQPPLQSNKNKISDQDEEYYLNTSTKNNNISKELKRVILCYADGRFESYEP